MAADSARCEAQYGENSSQVDLRSAHGVVYDAGSKYLVPLCVLACALAIFAAIYAYFTDRESKLRYETLSYELRDAKVASQLLERRYIDMETYAVLNGWKVPKDDQHGPLGNIERMKGERK